MIRKERKQLSNARNINRIALLLTIGLHGIVATISLYVFIGESYKSAPVVFVEFATPKLDMQRSTVLRSIPTVSRSKVKIIDLRTQTERRNSIVDSKNGPLIQKNVFDTTHAISSTVTDRFTKKAQDRGISQQEAMDELMSLLDRHPEFRETIMHKIFADEASLPFEEPKFNLRLTELLKNEKWKSSYEYELMKRGGGGYTGPYDPVHGYNRDQKIGLQIDVFKLLNFLKELIGMR